MKNKLLTSLLLLFSTLGYSQQSLSFSAVDGTWQVIAVDIPTLFTFNKETQVFTPSERIQSALKNDSDGEAAKGIADLHKMMPAELAKNYLEINADKTFLFTTNNESIRGTYNIFTAPSVPEVDSSEDEFIKFVENYGYNGGIKLDVYQISKDDIWANAKFNNNETSLIINHQTMKLGNINLPCSFTLKKISKAEAVGLKENVKKTAENNIKADKEKQEQLRKADEEKNGKVYYTADKEPYYSGEKEMTLKISERLMVKAGEVNTSPGKYTVTVLYTVNTDGTITDITMPTDPNPGSSFKDYTIQQLTRLPVMSPAEINGQKVRFRVKKEFRFILSEL